MLFSSRDVCESERRNRPTQTAAVKSRHTVRNTVLTRNISAVMADVPARGEAVHFIAHGNVNAFTFVLYLVEFCSPVRALACAVYRISNGTLVDLLALLDSGKIGGITLAINDNVQRLKPDTFADLNAASAARESFRVGCVDNHAKIIAADTGRGCFVIEGSGNWSDNARIEQYVFCQSPEVYQFHSEWIKRSVGNRWT